jgi:hypothetical protein
MFIYKTNICNIFVLQAGKDMFQTCKLTPLSSCTITTIPKCHLFGLLSFYFAYYFRMHYFNVITYKERITTQIYSHQSHLDN